MYLCKVINQQTIKINQMTTQLINKNFEIYPIGTKVQSYDKDGYFVMRACGTIEKHLGDGYAIIKDFDGVHWSTVSLTNIVEIEVLN